MIGIGWCSKCSNIAYICVILRFSFYFYIYHNPMLSQINVTNSIFNYKYIHICVSVCNKLWIKIMPGVKYLWRETRWYKRTIVNWHNILQHSASRYRIAIENKRAVRSSGIAGMHCLNTTVTAESTEWPLHIRRCRSQADVLHIRHWPFDELDQLSDSSR